MCIWYRRTDAIHREATLGRTTCLLNKGSDEERHHQYHGCCESDGVFEDDSRYQR